MDSNNYLIMFKRDFYWTFGSEFADEGESGIGETVNKSDLVEGIRRNVKTILVIYRNGAVYRISVEDFLNHCHKRVNHENKETLSINLKWLTKEVNLFG